MTTRAFSTGEKAVDLGLPPQKRQKKSRLATPSMEIRGAIISAAKTQNPALAMEAFDRALTEGASVWHIRCQLIVAIQPKARGLPLLSPPFTPSI